MKHEIMSPEKLAASLAVPDLTDPQNGVHAINIVMEKILVSLEQAHGPIVAEPYRTDPRVTVEDNYDKLRFPADNVGRSSRYTRYVSEEVVLRTHTSAAVPQWLRETDWSVTEDVIVPLPGLCYRRDVKDRTHSPEINQMDIWRVKKGEPRLTRPDLEHLIETVLGSIGITARHKWRGNEVEHPYTINGLEVEVLVDGEWLEVLECGEIHPEILHDAGLDPSDYSGLAMGMGLDRLVMIIKEIDDIRVIRSKDLRVAKQMQDLEPYKTVSNQPATKRVLSYSASIDKTEEDICEQIIDALGENVSYLEDIQVDEIMYADLKEKARGNLGIDPHQKNVVATLTFRPLEGSLPKKKVNEWVEYIYPILNEGQKGYI